MNSARDQVLNWVRHIPHTVNLVRSIGDDRVTTLLDYDRMHHTQIIHTVRSVINSGARDPLRAWSRETTV